MGVWTWLRDNEGAVAALVLVGGLLWQGIRQGRGEAIRRHQIDTIVAALTPDHGESVHDWIKETRDGQAALKEGQAALQKMLDDHCITASERMGAIEAEQRRTNDRFYDLAISLTTQRRRKPSCPETPSETDRQGDTPGLNSTMRAIGGKGTK